MPTTGVKASLVQELAGLSPIGTTAFFKTMCSVEVFGKYVNFSFLFSFTVLRVKLIEQPFFHF